MPTRIVHAGDNGKSTQLEVERRVDIVLGWVISGFQRRDIIELCGDNFSVRPSTADMYIAKAHNILKKSAAVDRERELGLCIARFATLYNRSELADPKVAAGINKELAALLGLSKIKVEFSGKVDHEHSVDASQAGSIFDILADAGVIIAPVDATEAD